MNTSNQKQNRCIHCNHELPEGASFCPYCETEQIISVPLQAPRRKKKVILAVIAVILAAAAIAFIIWHFRQPGIYEGDSKVSYRLGKETLDVIVSFDASSGKDGHLNAEKTIMLPEGDHGAHPLWLCVYNSEDPAAGEAFSDQIEKCTLEAIPVQTQDSGDASATEDSGEHIPAESTEGETGHVSLPMEISNPHPVEDPSLAAIWSGDVLFSPENGTNELRWTITMKNGDRILLSQTLTCSAYPVIHLNYASTPLETVDDIKAAIASVDSNAVLNLTLPPVTFDEPLILADRTVNLIGTTDGEQMTTFTQTIEVDNRKPSLAEFTNLTFQGDGGTGLLAYECILLSRCTFRGWETGIDAVEGSWPVIEECTFEENDIGFRFNSLHSTASSDGCNSTTFRNNGIGAYLMQIPGDLPFAFPDCTFEGNGEDIKKDSK